MNYILIGLGAGIIAILIFSILNFLIKMGRPAKSAPQGIWNAVYFIQLKQYKKALSILADVEAEFAMTPQVMSDFCVQKASALKGLKQYSEAADAYDLLLDALQNVDQKVVQNESFLNEIKECYVACDREEDFRKWEIFFENLPEWIEMNLREATEDELDTVIDLCGLDRETAEAAREKDELLVAEVEDDLVAAAILKQVEDDEEQIMLLQSFAVVSGEKSEQYTLKFLRICEQFSLQCGCSHLRYVIEESQPSIPTLMKNSGYSENESLLEKKL